MNIFEILKLFKGKEKNNKNKIKKADIKKAGLEIYPSYLDSSNFKYIKIDDKYMASLVIYDYPYTIAFGQIIDSIDKTYLYDMSMYISKLDTIQVLKNISYNISNSKAEIKTTTESRIDLDILNKQEDDLKKLRRDIQINNEDVYRFNLVITFYSYSESELFKILKEFQSKLFSKQIYSNITNFRNLDFYLLTLPLNNYSNNLINKTYRNMTTSALCNNFPFYTRSVFDKNGVIFGYTKNDNKITIIDIFDKKYLNSNVTIFGSSGSGKSYFTKLLITRNFFKGKIQYIFDIEGEYINLAKSLKIPVLSFGTRTINNLNIMDIYESDIKINGKDTLSEKIKEIIEFFKLAEKFTNNEIIKLKGYIKKAYLNKGITDKIGSLYVYKEGSKIFLDKKIKYGKMFPNMYELLNIIKEDSLKEKITSVINEYEVFANYTNIDFFKGCVFNMNNLTNTNIKKLHIISYYILNKLLNYLKNNCYNENLIINIDEIWKYIVKNKTTDVAGIVSALYKSIRKNNASIVTITQDISDFFNLDEGTYGKNILNNSEFKIFFRIEYSDTDFLSKLNVINKENLFQISRLEKGNMFLGFCNNIAFLKVKASDYEKEIIEGVDKN